MDRLKLDILKYRGNSSTVFTGRPEGKMARYEMKLDSKDEDNNSYVVIIPKNTTSFNSSFFLGLFFDSIKKIGSIDLFNKKYQFEIEEQDAEWKAILERNIAECLRKATNELNHSTGIDF